jgi:hypothetical protein
MPKELKRMSNKGSYSKGRMRKQVAALYSTHSNALMEVLEFDNIDCWIFLYLFYKKVYEKAPFHSGYQICKAVKAIVASYRFLRKPQRVSDKQIYESLDKLVRLRYLERRETMKVRKKSKRPGRPPICLYEVRSIAAIREKIKEDIREKEKRIMEALESLGTIEEAVGGSAEKEVE